MELGNNSLSAVLVTIVFAGSGTAFWYLGSVIPILKIASEEVVGTVQGLAAVMFAGAAITAGIALYYVTQELRR